MKLFALPLFVFTLAVACGRKADDDSLRVPESPQKPSTLNLISEQKVSITSDITKKRSFFFSSSNSGKLSVNSFVDASSCENNAINVNLERVYKDSFVVGSSINILQAGEIKITPGHYAITVTKNQYTPCAKFSVTFNVRLTPETQTTTPTNPIPTPLVGEINPMAFNAFELWRDGSGTYALSSPDDYDTQQGTSPSDNVFYVGYKSWPQQYNGILISNPTKGSEVSNDTLIYPSNNGRTLKLKFSPILDGETNLFYAALYCKKHNQRLPTIRELFDYCTAETERDSNGLYYKNRCGERLIWSASVNADNRQEALQFSGHVGALTEQSHVVWR